jgi:hypothetical protein
VIELVDRPHQAEVALLDQVEQLHAASGVALGDADDEAQVGLGQLALGPLTALHRPHQTADLGVVEQPRLLGCLVDALRRPVALLDELGQPALVVTGQQVDLTDLAQVHPDAVRRQPVGARCGAADSATAPPAEQVLVGLVVTCGQALRRVRPIVDLVRLIVDVVALDGLVERDAGLGKRVGDGLEDVARELDVAQHVGHLLGVDAPRLATALEQ